MVRLTLFAVMVSTLLLSSYAWFPRVKEPPYQLVKTWGGKGDAQDDSTSPLASPCQHRKCLSATHSMLVFKCSILAVTSNTCLVNQVTKRVSLAVL